MKIVKRRLADGSVKEYRYEKKPKARKQAKVLSLKAIILEYQQSGRWAELRGTSKQTYRKAFDKMVPLHGVHIASIKRRNVIRLRDLYLNTPAAANNVQGVLNTLLNYARDMEYIPFNPAAGLKRLRIGQHRAWTETQVQQTLDVVPEFMRRLIVLGLFTGQRVGDLVKMRWDQIDGEYIKVTQEKTSEMVWVPCHAELRAELEIWKQERLSPMILTNGWGRPWKSASHAATSWWNIKHKRKGGKKLGAYQDLKMLTLHGLRVTAATRLAEAGCSTHEIMAITGHRTLAMVDHYTRETRQKQTASAAILKLEAKKGKTRENGA